MNFKTLLAILGISFFAIACKSKIAFDYSELIVTKEKSLEPAIIDTENKAERYFTSMEYDSLVLVSRKMEDKINEVLQEIKNKPAPDVPEGENFKKASVRYFEFMKSIYASYKDYGLQTTEEGRVNQRDKMLDIVKEKGNRVVDMQNAQRKYAKANGFNLKNEQ